jgi:hypothetical protein
LGRIALPGLGDTGGDNAILSIGIIMLFVIVLLVDDVVERFEDFCLCKDKCKSGNDARDMLFNQ